MQQAAKVAARPICEPAHCAADTPAPHSPSTYRSSHVHAHYQRRVYLDRRADTFLFIRELHTSLPPRALTDLRLAAASGR